MLVAEFDHDHHHYLQEQQEEEDPQQQQHQEEEVVDRPSHRGPSLYVQNFCDREIGSITAAVKTDRSRCSSSVSEVHARSHTVLVMYSGSFVYACICSCMHA